MRSQVRPQRSQDGLEVLASCAAAECNLGVIYADAQGVIQDNVYSHMWWNFVTSSGNKDAVSGRDAVSKRMNSTDISAAQKLARECVRKRYKGC
jgi:hypothetical protein